MSAADADVDVLLMVFVGGDRGSCHWCARPFAIGEPIYFGWCADGSVGLAGYARLCSACRPLLSQVVLWERRF